MSRHKHYVPDQIRPPFGNYVHAVEVSANSRILFTSGQLGCSKDDAIPESVTEQAEICFQNIIAILASADMDITDVARINTYLTSREDFGKYMAVRDKYVASPPPASTLLIVQGFTRAEFNIEIEVTAAKMTE